MSNLFLQSNKTNFGWWQTVETAVRWACILSRWFFTIILNVCSAIMLSIITSTPCDLNYVNLSAIQNSFFFSLVFNLNGNLIHIYWIYDLYTFFMLCYTIRNFCLWLLVLNIYIGLKSKRFYMNFSNKLGPLNSTRLMNAINVCKHKQLSKLNI